MVSVGSGHVFDAAVGVAGEAASVTGVYGSVFGEGPAAKAGALVIEVGLLELRSGVHDEGAMLGDGFSDWAAL